MPGFFENIAKKCLNQETQYVAGSDYEIIINENKSMKIENEKYKNLLNLYKEEIRILKIQNKKLKDDNSIRI